MVSFLGSFLDPSESPLLDHFRGPEIGHFGGIQKPIYQDPEGLRSGRSGTGYPQMAQRAVATDIQGMGISRRPVKTLGTHVRPSWGSLRVWGTPKMVIFGGSEILGSGV